MRLLECIPKSFFFLGTDLSYLVCDLNSKMSYDYHKIILSILEHARPVRECCLITDGQKVSQSLVVMLSSSLQDYQSFKWDLTTLFKRVGY